MKIEPMAGNVGSGPNFLVFGIDLGTTYSGVAWAWSKQPTNINIISKWDTQLYGNSTSQKVPTAIHYSSNPSTSSSPQSAISWGYDIPLNATPVLEWFKLLLLDDADLDESPHLRDSEQIRKARQLLAATGKSVEDVIADYLQQLWGHALASVVRQVGAEVVEQIPFRVVLTVPAIWKAHACKKMNDAARKAGIVSERDCGPTTLKIMTEPECAARATFGDLEERPDVRLGDTITVVDCGGGTADLISYAVNEVEPLKVSECVEGQGGLCGAIFLDQDFEKMLKKTIGDKAWDLASAEDIKTMLNNSWEYGIKLQFDGREKAWPVTPPYSMMKSLKRGQIMLEHRQIVEVFDNVISQIQKLVRKQVNKVKEKTGTLPKYIILVGGFGRCKYLYEKLVKKFNYVKGSKGPTILQADGFAPWTAICRGAVGSCISDSVTVISRISRASYGISLNVRFKDKVHEERDRFYCQKRCYNKARCQMLWHLRRGDNTYEKQPVEWSVSFSFFEDEGWTGPYWDTYQNIYVHDEPTNRSPPPRKEPSVRRLCRIRFRCPEAFENLKATVNKDGKVVRAFTYKVCMTSYGSSVEFEVKHQGRTLGEHKMEVLFESGGADRPMATPVAGESSANLGRGEGTLEHALSTPSLLLVERLRRRKPT